MQTQKNVNASQNNQLEISFQVKDETSLIYIDFNFKHTRHSFLRAEQRGISPLKIATVLQYGECIYKQGLLYFILGENNIPESLNRQKDKMKNTVVVVAGDSNDVVTCYRSSNPFKNIRIKSKRLSKKFKKAA